MSNQTEHPFAHLPDGENRCGNLASTSPGVLVIFHGGSEIPLLRFLKPGFKHCFALIKCQSDIANDKTEPDPPSSDAHGRPAQDAWIVVDPLSHQTEVGYYAGFSAQELTERFEAYGCRVVPYELYQAPKRVPYFRPYSCVEVIKRILGILDLRIVTPWQLYQRLTKIS